MKFKKRKGAIMNKEELIDKAYEVRKNVLRMAHVDKRGFISQSLGAADFLTVLYSHAMRFHADDPKWEGRDRFLLSAGHNAIAVYAAMAEEGFFPKDWLDTYGLDNSRLPMSCMPAYTPGIEISGGSIGLGLPIAVGMAMGLKLKKSDAKVYVMMGVATEGWPKAPPGKPPCPPALISLTISSALWTSTGFRRTALPARSWIPSLCMKNSARLSLMCSGLTATALRR